MDGQEGRSVSGADENASVTATMWVVLSLVAVSNVQAAITLTGVNVVLPLIAREFSASALIIGWMPTAFILTNTILILPFGRLADARGRKWIFLAGVLVFGVSSFFTIFAPSMAWVLGLRVAQAVGSAMLQASALAIVVGRFPASMRGFAIGITTSCLYFGMAFGPFLAGFLSTHFGWRAIFWFQAPISLFIFLALVTRLQHRPRKDRTFRFDWVGFSLLVSVLTTLVVGASAIPATYAYVMLTSAAMLAIVFVKHQLQADEPLLPLARLIKNKPFRSAVLNLLSMYAANFPVLFLLSLYLQLVLGIEVQDAGAILIVQAGLMALMAPLAGRLSDSVAPRYLCAAGSAFAAIGMFALSRAGFETSVQYVVSSLAMIGIGMGLFSTPNASLALGSVPPDRLSLANAVVSVMRNLGSISGTAIVLSLMAYLIGNAELSSENAQQLRQVTQVAFSISAVFAVLAMTNSLWSQVRADKVAAQARSNEP